MDKQTAIDLLDNLLGMVEDNHESDYDAALHMGIDALKEKTQLSKEDATKDATFDYIDRQAAVDAADRIISRDESGNNDVVKAMTAWKEFIKALPSAQELISEAHDTAWLDGYTAGQDAQSEYVALHESCTDCPLYDRKNHNCPRFNRVIPTAIRDAQPEKDAYMKAVYTWLLDYQIKSADLKGRYTPYEVLSWVVNDWRKEHE